ncbi:MAG: multicopper oxidase family protein, partial [Candidatus Angelobacter sp.]
MSHNDDGFFLSEKSSKARLREAENARKNRAEIVKAFSQGKVTRRELVKWGLITSGGLLAPIHGLNPFVNSAYASGGTAGNIGTGIPTGAPPSPTFGVQPFSTPMPRFDVIARGNNPLGGDLTPVPQAQANQTQQPLDPALVNGQTGLTGPIEGRP